MKVLLSEPTTYIPDDTTEDDVERFECKSLVLRTRKLIWGDPPREPEEVGKRFGELMQAIYQEYHWVVDAADGGRPSSDDEVPPALATQDSGWSVREIMNTYPAAKTRK